jgi:hypothetical protein
LVHYFLNHENEQAMNGYATCHVRNKKGEPLQVRLSVFVAGGSSRQA